MVVIKSNRLPIKVTSPRPRSERKAALKARNTFKLKQFVIKRTRRSSMKILDLPSEALQNIFSYLSIKDLFCKVRPVCRRFKEISLSPTLWKTIDIQNDVPTEILRSWIRSSKLLKRFSIRDRNDVNTIAEEVSKHCKNLESVRLQNCWGSSKNLTLHSTPLCNLVTRCPKLSNFNFSQSRFLSCKFFRLISRNNRCRNVKKCNYTGPMTPKQMKALFNALDDHDVHDTATIGNISMNHRFKLRDIVKYVRNVSTQNQLINEVWENIHYGIDEMAHGVHGIGGIAHGVAYVVANNEEIGNVQENEIIVIPDDNHINEDPIVIDDDVVPILIPLDIPEEVIVQDNQINEMIPQEVIIINRIDIINEENPNEDILEDGVAHIAHGIANIGANEEERGFEMNMDLE